MDRQVRAPRSRDSLRHAARATAHALRLGCLSRRISRVYLYHWQAPLKVTSWDSGLLDARGRPRPAYTALSDSLDRGERAGRSGGRRALCRDSHDRIAALDGWLHRYNHHRPYAAIGRQAPINRLNHLLGTYN